MQNELELSEDQFEMEDVNEFDEDIHMDHPAIKKVYFSQADWVKNLLKRELKEVKPEIILEERPIITRKRAVRSDDVHQILNGPPKLSKKARVNSLRLRLKAFEQHNLPSNVSEQVE